MVVLCRHVVSNCFFYLYCFLALHGVVDPSLTWLPNYNKELLAGRVVEMTQPPPLSNIAHVAIGVVGLPMRETKVTGIVPIPKVIKWQIQGGYQGSWGCQ